MKNDYFTPRLRTGLSRNIYCILKVIFTQKHVAHHNVSNGEVRVSSPFRAKLFSKYFPIMLLNISVTTGSIYAKLALFRSHSQFRDSLFSKYFPIMCSLG